MQNKGDIKNIQQKLYNPGTKTRKGFGLLERPSLPPTIPQVSYKLFVAGQAGAGKSYLIHRLAGSEIPAQYTETVGIEVTYVYWPMRIENRLMLFRLELWDTGEASIRRYNHIQPACTDSVDGVLACFSVTSKEQWLAIPSLIASIAQPKEHPAIMIVATRWDSPSDIVISETELWNYESHHDIPLLKLPPLTSHVDENSSITPVLNFICRQLWNRDQRLLSAGKEKS